MPTLSRSAEHPLSGVKTDIGRTEMSAYLSFPKTSSGRIRAMRQATMVVKRERCGDCHALEGEYHELGCDLERCPFCGDQLISCDCCYEILNIDGSPGTRVEFGLTPEQRKQWERTLNDKGRVPFIMYPNMCAKCGKLWPEMFSVPDKEWERYVEKGERDKMLCKPCYDQIKIWIDESRGTETA
jgi:hypothetical protein